MLRETFNQYRREYAEHDASDRAWWKRRVRTPWMVYFSDGCHSFDGNLSRVDDRDTIDNDMFVDLGGAGVYTNSAAAKDRNNADIPGYSGVGSLQVSRGKASEIKIRV